MNREFLLNLINSYRHSEMVDSVELLDLFHQFVLNSPNCFQRENLFGHITGSAFILNQEQTHLVLMHHKKLDKWIQVGGHADGHPIPHEVALKEAFEETGITNLQFYPTLQIQEGVPLPLDLDIHLIPEHRSTPVHLHFDIRYLLIAPKESALEICSEAHALEWVALNDIEHYSQERSLIRCTEKIQSLLDPIGTKK